MLQPGDEEWIREKHPGLTVAGEILSGSIQFRAGYDAKINQFFSIEEGATASTDAVILSGTFKVRIEPRADRSTSRLPSLYVHGIESAANRHFNSADKSACLCSPLEENEFLQPELQFRVFLEQLVIPFLYGQVYFSSYGSWPWAEYRQGATRFDSFVSGMLAVPNFWRSPESCSPDSLPRPARNANWLSRL